MWLFFADQSSTRTGHKDKITYRDISRVGFVISKRVPGLVVLKHILLECTELFRVLPTSLRIDDQNGTSILCAKKLESLGSDE